MGTRILTCICRRLPACPQAGRKAEYYVAQSQESRLVRELILVLETYISSLGTHVDAETLYNDDLLKAVVMFSRVLF